MNTMGGFFKEYRVRQGLSQTEIAKALKVKPQFVSNWERGKSNPPLRYYKQLGKLLKVDRHTIAATAQNILADKIIEVMK